MYTHIPPHTPKRVALVSVSLNRLTNSKITRCVRMCVCASVFVFLYIVILDLHICHLSVDGCASTIAWIITESHIKGQRGVQVPRGCTLWFRSLANHTYREPLTPSSSRAACVPPPYEILSTVCCNDIYDTARSYFIAATQL